MSDFSSIFGRLRATHPWQIAVAFTAIVALSVLVVVVLAAISSSQAEGVLRGSADLLKALAWPAAVVFVIVTFREPISAQFHRVTEISMPGASIKLQQVINQKLEQVLAEAKTQSPVELGEVSSADFDRARVIAMATTPDNLPEIRSRILDLAAEYRRVRGDLASGGDRTALQATLVAKMRVLGQAAYPLRGEFAFSDDPGCRLAAIAITQVQPDPTMLTWLATRIGPSERRFSQYQALQALVIAARNGNASQAAALDHAYRIARQGYEDLAENARPEGENLLSNLNKEVTRLRCAFKAVE